MTGEFSAAAIAVVLLVMGAGIYAVALVDRLLLLVISGRPLHGADLLRRPLRTSALLIVQSRAVTERPDHQTWALAPALLAGLALAAMAVVPLGPAFAAADSDVGFVVFAAAIAFVMVAVYLHGWSANAPFPLVGGYRFIAQALSYQIPFLLALLATALPAESLGVGDIVRAQESLWNVARQPLGLPLYLVVAVGVTFWGPLNFPDADDLSGGTRAEVSGAARLAWSLARAAMLVSVAAMGAASFLGGWLGPWLPGPAWVLLKTFLLLAVIVASRHLFARVRLESFVMVAWTVLVPLALVDVFVSGTLLL